MILQLFLVYTLLLLETKAYKAIRRFGHSVVLVNNSLYFYGGDTAVGTPADNPLWISDLAILPIDVPFALTRIPWKPSSGPQLSLGGPTVYSHIAFAGGNHGGDMVIVGGVMPTNNMTDEAKLAYTYDCDLGRWNSFSLPRDNYLNRQGAFATIVDKGVAYIWGGKRARTQKYNGTTPLPSTMYRLDSRYPTNSSSIQSPLPNPPLRYSHTQTLVNDRLIVILGGFDGGTGSPVSMQDIWTFDTITNHWAQVTATLDKENKPDNRSSHSEVLMSDGVSILIYGGYDGYHVYNDVAVLDTRSWTWTVKNTNAAVQGRADHTATLIGNNMIVAFGFTGVSTSLTVMSDIEVLDITTWSWTSYYVPSPGYPGNDDTHGIGGGGNQFALPGSPSMAIVAGAVTGSLVVFVLIIVALYIFNFQQKHHTPSLQAQDGLESCNDSFTMPPPLDHINTTDPFKHIILPTPPPSPASPLRVRTADLQKKHRNNSLLPSPWKDYSTSPSQWLVKRSATTSGFKTTTLLPSSKPDEPTNQSTCTVIQRAVTTTNSSVLPAASTPSPTIQRHLYMDKTQQEDELQSNKHQPERDAIDYTSKRGSHSVGNNDDDIDEDNAEDDDGFDRQEFILHSGEVSSDQYTILDGDTLGNLSPDREGAPSF